MNDLEDRKNCELIQLNGGRNQLETYLQRPGPEKGSSCSFELVYLCLTNKKCINKKTFFKCSTNKKLSKKKTLGSPFHSTKNVLQMDLDPAFEEATH